MEERQKDGGKCRPVLRLPSPHVAETPGRGSRVKANNETRGQSWGHWGSATVIRSAGGVWERARGACSCERRRLDVSRSALGSRRNTEHGAHTSCLAAVYCFVYPSVRLTCQSLPGRWHLAGNKRQGRERGEEAQELARVPASFANGRCAWSARWKLGQRRRLCHHHHHHHWSSRCHRSPRCSLPVLENGLFTSPPTCCFHTAAVCCP